MKGERIMASTSSEVFRTVLSKAYENPTNQPNLFVVHEMPTQLNTESCIVLQNAEGIRDVFYVTETGQIDKITLLEECQASFAAMLETKIKTMECSNPRRLAHEEIKQLIETHSHYRIEDSQTLAERFVLETIYKNKDLTFRTVVADEESSIVSVAYSDNRAAYFLQLRQLCNYMCVVLIPRYFFADAPERITIAQDNLRGFLAKIQASSFRNKQTAMLYAQLKKDLEFCCYIYYIYSQVETKKKQVESLFKWLCSQLGMCAPGAVTSISKNVEDLKELFNKNSSLLKKLTAFRTTLLEVLIRDHIEKNRVPVSYEIHVMRFFYETANFFDLGVNVPAGISRLSDQHGSSNFLHLHPEETRMQIYRDFSDKFHRTSIIDLITVEIISNLLIYRRNDYENSYSFARAIEEGVLAPLFKLPYQPLLLNQFLLTPDGDLRRADFPRSLRGYVERLLVVEEFISPERSVSVKLKFSNFKLQLRLVAKGDSYAEYQELRHSIIRTLCKIQGITVDYHNDEDLIEVLTKDYQLYYTVLLSLGDILLEFDIEKTSLEEVLIAIGSLDNGRCLSAQQEEFIKQRLDTTRRLNPRITPNNVGINPLYVIDNEEEAIVLLEWDEFVDYRDPSFLGLARHSSGMSVVEWSLRTQKTNFVIAFLSHRSFDDFVLPADQVEQIEKYAVFIVRTFIGKTEISLLRSYLNRFMPSMNPDVATEVLKVVFSELDATAEKVEVIKQLLIRGATLQGAEISANSYFQLLVECSRKDQLPQSPMDFLENELSLDKEQVIAFLHDNLEDPIVRQLLLSQKVRLLKESYFSSSVRNAIIQKDIAAAACVIMSLYNSANMSTMPTGFLFSFLKEMQYNFSVQYFSLLIYVIRLLAPIAYEREDYEVLSFLKDELASLNSSFLLRKSEQRLIGNLDTMLSRISSRSMPTSEPSCSSAVNVVSAQIRQRETSSIASFPVEINREELCGRLNSGIDILFHQLSLQITATSSELQERLSHIKKLILSRALMSSGTKELIQLLEKLQPIILEKSIEEQEVFRGPLLAIVGFLTRTKGVVRCKVSNNPVRIDNILVDQMTDVARFFLDSALIFSAPVQQALEMIAGKNIGMLVGRKEQYSLLFEMIYEELLMIKIVNAPLTQEKRKYFSELEEIVVNTALLSDKFIAPCHVPEAATYRRSGYHFSYYQKFLITHKLDDVALDQFRHEQSKNIICQVSSQQLEQYFILHEELLLMKTINEESSKFSAQAMSDPLRQKLFHRCARKRKLLEKEIAQTEAATPGIQKLRSRIKSELREFSQWENFREVLLREFKRRCKKYDATSSTIASTSNLHDEGSVLVQRLHASGEKNPEVSRLCNDLVDYLNRARSPLQVVQGEIERFSREYANYNEQQIRDFSHLLDGVEFQTDKIRMLHREITRYLNKLDDFNENEPKRALQRTEFLAKYEKYRGMEQLTAEYQLKSAAAIRRKKQEALDKVEDKGKAMGLTFTWLSQEAGTRYRTYRNIKDLLDFCQENKKYLSPKLPVLKVSFVRKTSETSYSENGVVYVEKKDFVLQGACENETIYLTECGAPIPQDGLEESLARLNIPFEKDNGRFLLKITSSRECSVLRQRLEVQLEKVKKSGSSLTSQIGSSTNHGLLIPSSSTEGLGVEGSTQASTWELPYAINSRVFNRRKLNTLMPLTTQQAGSSSDEILNAERFSKIVLVGERGSGKSSLLRRFLQNTYDGKWHYATSADVPAKEKLIYVRGQRIQLQLWDFVHNIDRIQPGGLQAYEQEFFKDVNTVMHCIDVTSTFLIEASAKIKICREKVLQWSHNKDVQHVFVFTKGDEVSNRQISDEAIENFCKEFDVVGILTTAKTPNDASSYDAFLIAIFQAVNPLLQQQEDERFSHIYSSGGNRMG
jgi:GTPase SAR1 family protein